MSAHILVVEDNPDNSQLVSWILEDEGYRVSCVASAERCLQVLAQESFDLILMDISLPGISGKEATARIRNTPGISATPILALTAHAIDGEQQSILNCGVDDLLTKPIDEEQLISALRRYLKDSSSGFS